MEKISIFEVGPRDGLQNEKAIIPAKDKIELINLLSTVGFQKIEATSFVSPKWVPQLADAADVMAGITRRPGVTYSVLTPNLMGFERALEAGADEVAIFGAASESFSQKNINCSIDESIKRFAPVVSQALKANIPVRGYVSCVAGCPYEGAVDPVAVSSVARKLLDMSCYEISLGDTVGIGTPDTISAVLDEVLKYAPAMCFAGHFHDTNNQALNNVLVSLDYGLRTFDSAVGGLGGCPFAPGAKGNVSTMALAETLTAKGWETGLNLVLLKKAENFLHSRMSGNVERT